MNDIESLLLCAFVGICYGAWAFLNTHALFKKYLISTLAAIATFGVTALCVKFEIMVLLGILTVVLPITTIILTFIGKNKKG